MQQPKAAASTDPLYDEIGDAAREGVRSHAGPTMSPERKTLADAMSRAAGELPQSDPRRIIDALSQVKTRAEQNITSIRENRSVIEAEYQRFKAAADTAEESQQRTIAMIDAALQAGETKKPPRKKRQRKPRPPAKETSTTAAAIAAGPSLVDTSAPSAPAEGASASGEESDHDGDDFRGT